MTRKLLLLVSLAMLVSLLAALPGHTRTGTRGDANDALRSYQLDRFNLVGEHEFVGKEEPVPHTARIPRTEPLRQTVGTATSPHAGIGVGVSIDLTFDDMQYGFPIGRYVSHYWNGEVGASAEAGVHFVYESVIDTVPGDPMASPILTGYNVYDAAVTTGNWPRGQNTGCDLQGTDSAGYGKWANMAVLGNTNAVFAATTRFWAPQGVDFIGDNAKWLKENDNCLLLYADAELLGVQPPMFIEVEITETDPGFKGDTVQGGTKPATIETGAVIQVPMYLNQGETVRVDTRDGKFVARV